VKLTRYAQSRPTLEERLFQLEETGPTALGPAVVAALGMCEGKRGARIVVCTDGVANIGLGSLDELRTDQDKANANEFYERVGRMAADQVPCTSTLSEPYQTTAAATPTQSKYKHKP
jgi:hypothetical protein